MKTIRARLLVLLLTGLAVVLAGGGAAVYWIADSNLTDHLDAGLKARAQTLASLVSVVSDRFLLFFRAPTKFGDDPCSRVRCWVALTEKHSKKRKQRSPNWPFLEQCTHVTIASHQTAQLDAQHVEIARQLL